MVGRFGVNYKPCSSRQAAAGTVFPKKTPMVFLGVVLRAKPFPARLEIAQGYLSVTPQQQAAGSAIQLFPRRYAGFPPNALRGIPSPIETPVSSLRSLRGERAVANPHLHT